MAEVKCVSKCPQCGGEVDGSQEMATEIVWGSDDNILWEGDIGEEVCIGANGETGCGWWHQIGDVAGYNDAKERARAAARAASDW